MIGIGLNTFRSLSLPENLFDNFGFKLQSENPDSKQLGRIDMAASAMLFSFHVSAAIPLLGGMVVWSTMLSEAAVIICTSFRPLNRSKAGHFCGRICRLCLMRNPHFLLFVDLLKVLYSYGGFGLLTLKPVRVIQEGSQQVSQHSQNEA
ncbi:MAG: hypothetical protein AAGF04_03820 [Chlamydiota bacterium]